MAFSPFTKTTTVSNADWNDNDEDDGYDDASFRMKLSSHTYVRAKPVNCFGNAEVSAVRWKEEGSCQNLISSATITAIARACPTTRAVSGIQVHFSISSLAFVHRFHKSIGYSRLD